MTPAALQLVHGALLELQSAINDRVNKKELRKQMDKLEQVAGNRLIRPSARYDGEAPPVPVPAADQ